VSNNYVPNATDLLAGELARASDINLRYSYVIWASTSYPHRCLVDRAFLRLCR